MDLTCYWFEFKKKKIKAAHLWLVSSSWGEAGPQKPVAKLSSTALQRSGDRKNQAVE